MFAYPVSDPEKYGLVEFDEDGHAPTIQEKPVKPKSQYAIDNIKIMNELSWYPSYDFNEALEYTVKWYLENMEWC